MALAEPFEIPVGHIFSKPVISENETSGFPDSVMIDYYNQEFRRAIVANNPHKSHFNMMMALRLMSKRIKNLHCE